MNNNDKIENTLRSAVSNAVPDVLGGIMDACDQQKGKVIYMEKKKNNTLRSVAAIAAVFVLLIAGIFLAKNFQGGSSGTLAAVVSFDVNPSIELSVDKNEKVLSAAGLNDEEFREVLASFDRTEEEVMGYYDAVLHLVSCAKGAEFAYNFGNEARYEPLELAREKDDLTLRAWRAHPNLRVMARSCENGYTSISNRQP